MVTLQFVALIRWVEALLEILKEIIYLISGKRSDTIFSNYRHKEGNHPYHYVKNVVFFHKD